MLLQFIGQQKQRATQRLEVRMGCSLGMKNICLPWDGGQEQEEEMEQGKEYNGERWG